DESTRDSTRLDVPAETLSGAPSSRLSVGTLAHPAPRPNMPAIMPISTKTARPCGVRCVRQPTASPVATSMKTPCMPKATDQRDEQHAAADAGRHREHSEDEADEEQRGRPYPPTDRDVRDCHVGGADGRAGNECERSKRRSDHNRCRTAAPNAVEIRDARS